MGCNQAAAGVRRWGARPTVTSRAYSPHGAAGPSRGCPEGEEALSLGVESGAHRSLWSAVHPGSPEGRLRPDPPCLVLLRARREVGNRSWIR